MDKLKESELKEELAFIEEILDESLQEKETSELYNMTTCDLLMEATIYSILLGYSQNKVKWLGQLEEYLYGFKPNKNTFDYELFRLKYYSYLLSYINGVPDRGFLEEFADKVEYFYSKEIRLSKQNLNEYHDLLIYLIEAGKYQKAKILSEKVVELEKPNCLGSVLNAYVNNKIDNKAVEEEIKNYRSFLTKNKKRINEVFTVALHYHNVYFNEMIGVNSITEVFKATF